MWAIGLWVRPVGPAVWGVSWLPYLFFGIILALLKAATAPTRGHDRPPDRVHTSDRRGVDEVSAEGGTAVAGGVVVWAALIVLAVAIAVGYLW